MSRILLIEDDPDVQGVLEHILASAGHTVDAVATHRAGMMLLEARSYDLVITDARLPDGDGIEIADAAKARGLKALILTGGASKFLHPYLWKPVRAHKLLKVVSQLLGEN